MRAAHDRADSEKRNERLRWAMQRAGENGRPVRVAEALNMSINTVKGHISGRNDFGTADARGYARLLNVSLAWLYLGIGAPDDVGPPIADERIRDVMTRLAAAPPEVRNAVLGYAEFALANFEKSLETATTSAS